MVHGSEHAVVTYICVGCDLRVACHLFNNIYHFIFWNLIILRRPGSRTARMTGDGSRTRVRPMMTVYHYGTKGNHASCAHVSGFWGGSISKFKNSPRGRVTCSSHVVRTVGVGARLSAALTVRCPHIYRGHRGIRQWSMVASGHRGELLEAALSTEVAAQRAVGAHEALVAGALARLGPVRAA